MDTEEINKQINLAILGFFNVIKNKEIISNREYADYIQVTDDTIRNWNNGKKIRNDSLKKISKYYSIEYIGSKNIQDVFIEYIYSNQKLKLNNIQKIKVKSKLQIIDILNYLVSEEFKKDFQKKQLIEINEKNIEFCKNILQKKILMDTSKNNFYDINPISKYLKDSILLSLNFYGDSIYKIRLFLNDDLSFSKCFKLKVLANEVLSSNKVKVCANLFENSLDYDKRADAYIIYTFNNYPQKNKQLLISRKHPIYIKRITNEKLSQQITTLTYLSSKMTVEELVNYNKFSDYVLRSIQSDFDMFLKNSLSIDNVLYFNDYNKKNNLFEAYTQELDFEILLIKQEILNILNNLNEDQNIIKILAINFQSFELIYKSIEQLIEKIKKDEKVIEIYVMDNSSILMNVLDKNEFSLFESNDISLSFYCVKSDFLDDITDEKELYNELDIVIIGMGSLSFFKNPQKYFVYINSWLKNNGKIFLSCYSTVGGKLNSYKNILIRNFPFISGASKNIGELFLNNSSYIRLYCKTYEKNEILQEVQKCFVIESTDNPFLEKIYFHPSFSFFIEPCVPKYTKEILRSLEKEYSISKNNRSNIGYFITLTAKKMVTDRNDTKVMKNGLIELNHSVAINRGWHFQKLIEKEPKYNSDTILVKTILLKSRSSEQLYCVLINSDSRLRETIDTGYSNIIGCKSFISDEIRLLTSREINVLGFEIGNLSPFSFYTNNCKFFYDNELFEGKSINNFIFGSGIPNKSYLVNKMKFKELLKKYNYEEVSVNTTCFDLLDY